MTFDGPTLFAAWSLLLCATCSVFAGLSWVLHVIVGAALPERSSLEDFFGDAWAYFALFSIALFCTACLGVLVAGAKVLLEAT